MPHFIINSIDVNGDCIRISDKELFNHLAKSLRIKEAETLLFIDENEIQYITKVEKITNKEIYTKVVDSYKSMRKLDLNIYLAQSVLKPDAQFNTIQKATELGIKGIIPLHTENCTIKQSIIKEKIDKWQKIALESVKQCERADIPKVFSPVSLSELLDEKDFDVKLAFVEKGSELTIKRYFKQNPISKDSKILAIIGPEGGFTQNEFNLFEQKNIAQITLGNLIYRADTATIVALSGIIAEAQNV